MGDLRLVELSAATIVAVNNLSLKPGQEEYLSPVSYGIAATVVNPQTTWQRVVLDGEEVRPRIEDVEVLDDLASRQKQDLLIYLRDEKAVPSIAERIRPREAMRAEGKVSIVMILDDGAQEVEIELPGKFPVNQQIANAVRAAPGVVSVEMR